MYVNYILLCTLLNFLGGILCFLDILNIIFSETSSPVLLPDTSLYGHAVISETRRCKYTAIVTKLNTLSITHPCGQFSFMVRAHNEGNPGRTASFVVWQQCVGVSVR